MTKEQKNKAMKVVHYIVTALLLGVVIWLVIAEVKRMKLAKELAEANTNGSTNGETTA